MHKTSRDRLVANLFLAIPVVAVLVVIRRAQSSEPNGAQNGSTP